MIKLLQRINEYLKINNLIDPKERIVVALSGGVDSSVLFYALKHLGFECIVAHVNHKKRIESEMEEKKIIELCNNTNTKYEILHLEKIDKNFEAKAHKKRYEFFLNVAKKYNCKYIATAHHADDNAETIFMNIMSGSNLYGFGGISKELVLDGIHVIRPLLFLSKDEIREFAEKNNIVYYEDSTNASDDYTRNRIRHHIIPALKNECGNLLDRTNSYSNQVHEAFDFIRGLSINYLKNNNNHIDIESFNSLHSFLKKDILCLLLENNNIERSENLINDLLDLLSNTKPQLSYNLSNDLVFYKRYNEAYISKETKAKAFSYTLRNKFDIVDSTQFKIYFTDVAPNGAKYLKLCYNDLAFPFTIRSRLNGDKIKLSIGEKKIKDLMIDHKIIKEDRDSIPLVVDGNGNILWVYDIAKSTEIFKYKDRYDIFLVLEVKANEK